MKMLLTTLFAAAALFTVQARAADAKHDGFGELTVDQVAALLAKGDVDVFDNNAQSEWQKGHVPGAKWVPFNEVKASDLPGDHSRKLVFYCHNEH